MFMIILIKNHIHVYHRDIMSIENMFVYRLLIVVHVKRMYIIMFNQNLVRILSIILSLFHNDIDHWIIIDMEKHTIHVGGICQLIPCMDQNHDDGLIIVNIIIRHQNGTNYLTDDK